MTDHKFRHCYRWCLQGIHQESEEIPLWRVDFLKFVCPEFASWIQYRLNRLAKFHPDCLYESWSKLIRSVSAFFCTSFPTRFVSMHACFLAMG